MKYICKNGHRTTTTWNNFSKGHRCLECSGRMQLNGENIKKEFEKLGFTLLTEYSTAKSKISYLCNNGHRRDTTWDTFRNIKRCPECQGLAKHSYDFVKDEFLKRGYTLLSDEYESALKKLKYKCKNNHISYITFNKLQQGCGCRKCYNLRNTGENHFNYNSNLSDEDRLLNRDYSEYHKWRLDVYKKDNYKCVICGSNKSINAHHLYNYADYPELRTDVLNGAVLCHLCHSEYHSIYGKKNNTREQFNEFLKNKKS